MIYKSSLLKHIYDNVVLKKKTRYLITHFCKNPNEENKNRKERGMSVTSNEQS